MAQKLVIVESPAKARTIGKFLGKEFTVKASVGHIRDLPKSSLGVDEANGYEPEYVVLPEKRKVVEELRAAARDAEEVYIATDPTGRARRSAGTCGRCCAGRTGRSGGWSFTRSRGGRSPRRCAGRGTST